MWEVSKFSQKWNVAALTAFIIWTIRPKILPGKRYEYTWFYTVLLYRIWHLKNTPALKINIENYTVVENKHLTSTVWYSYSNCNNWLNRLLRFHFWPKFFKYFIRCLTPNYRITKIIKNQHVIWICQVELDFCRFFNLWDFSNISLLVLTFRSLEKPLVYGARESLNLHQFETWESLKFTFKTIRWVIYIVYDILYTK